MCQSVCYFMRQVSIAEAPTLDDDSFEPIFDGEDSAETFAEIDENRELDLQSLIAMHFFKVFVESSKARFHLTLIPCRWYKDEYISSSEGYFNEKVIGNGNFNHSSTFEFTRKYTINDFSEEYSKQITRKQLKYGILMDEAKKAIQFAICNNDEELIKLIKEYNERKKAQYIQAESVKQQRALANRLAENDNQVICRPNGVLIEFNQVLDPLKHQPKGRPPGKHFKSSTELKSKSKSEATDGAASVVYVEEMDIIVALVLQSSHFMYNNKVIFNS
ncbi:hypothetical protein GLOIN_2v1485884 [Rhizophagus irregularis DAOM 181602=DAOM 197198]|uniref:Uncharacterized protein n=2 Tax=Rhizophagus irregularis TaxID=588596 RepID=A0A2P4P933_RHIID|nr:hypothetical protein GLOIN_2v1485884 [Rhizophagus irregularis DAOM 181602=DAOM 197198]POG61884.1 hypothetical protein GLOIN_2v1485884 [Rhizophagus irregularis DAOM 181602=DAOM 197198]|eukprot:XP_025168750.1 hypothetical protein GLOIN_2v1485884 [Rhizophagus irregularis DAOM 181602=DAOM 197198]